MLRSSGVVVLVGCLGLAGSAPPAFAQADPIAGSIRQMYEPLKRNLIATGQDLPDTLFAFQPTAEVRTAGAQLAHVANALFTICSASLGVDNPHAANVETGNYSPAELRRLLGESFALCDRAYAALTDASLAEEVAFFGNRQRRHFVMTYNLIHANEHYGNLVTYMRLNGIVPPSSRPPGR